MGDALSAAYIQMARNVAGVCVGRKTGSGRWGLWHMSVSVCVSVRVCEVVAPCPSIRARQLSGGVGGTGWCESQEAGLCATKGETWPASSSGDQGTQPSPPVVRCKGRVLQRRGVGTSRGEPGAPAGAGGSCGGGC